MASQTQSPFFRLPAELRNQIYELAFQETTATVQYPGGCCLLPSGILTACKQAYTEAIGLFYSNATFEFLGFDAALEWLVAVCPKQHVARVKRFHVGLTEFELCDYMHVEDEDKAISDLIQYFTSSARG